MKIEAKIENLSKTLEDIKNQIIDYKQVNNKDLNYIILAIDEILINIINYAYPENPNGTIEINFESLHGGELKITIIDYGIAFDPLVASNPDIISSLEERKIGGLGIFFIRKFIQNVTYSREADKNILSLYIH